MSKTMSQRMVDIQERLKSNIHLEVKNVDYDDNDGKWQATIWTEGNKWPYWRAFNGATPDDALKTVEVYLRGELKGKKWDQWNDPRYPQPGDFLRVATGKTKAKLIYEDWMKQVDKYISDHRFGLMSSDLSDMNYADWYADGMKPGAAAKKAIQLEDRGEVE